MTVATRPTLAMSSTAGFAMRYQLDAMIRALGDTADRAADTGDHTTARLIACLHSAREAADEIEHRTPVAPARRGVDLVKR